MSATIINGVPYINGKPARYDPMPLDNPLRGALSDYRCPECDARLGVEHQICLNACHLTAAARADERETRKGEGDVSRLTFGSLFAGIGGFDLGFKRAGMFGAWQVEIDDDARGVLTRRFPNSERHVDVREVGAHNLAPVDVICGGFPCQDLSVAGKRGGLAGARSGLFFELVRITHELRPSFLVWENVPGLLSSENGRDFATVLVSLDNIGYSGAWTILDSRYFGLAQRRRRVFGVFARDDIGAGPCAEILSLASRLRWHTTAGEEARKNVAPTIGAGANASGGTRPPGTRVDDVDSLQVTGTLSANRGGLDRPAGNANELDFCIPVARSQTARNTRLDGETDNFVAAPVTFGLMPRRGQFSDGDYSPTLNAGLGGMGAPGVAGRMGVRRLTPVECERLQGFPDGWTDGQSDSARYRQLGNAVSVPVVEWIGRRIVAVAAARSGADGLPEDARRGDTK